MTDEETGRAARALGLMALCGASLALFAQQLVGGWVADFVRTNALSLTNRHRLLLTLMAGGALGAGGAAAWLFRRRAAGIPTLTRAAHLCSPLALAGLLPAVARPQAWSDPLQATIAVAVFVVVLEPTLRVSLRELPARLVDALRRTLARVPPRVVRWAPAVVVVAAAMGYAAYMGTFTVLNHRRFNTMSYDLGQLDNQFWNALHGHPFRCTPLIREGDWSELRNHAELSLYALLPFYAIRPGAETLLIIQAVILASGAIPIYRFAARRLPRSIACLLALGYLLYPPLHGANFYDFHFQPIAAAFVLFAVDFLDQRRTALFILFFILAIGCREDISVGLAVLGLFLVVTGHRPRAGAAIAAAAGAYFVIVRFVIMPRFGDWWFGDIYKDLYPEGDHSLAGVVKTLLTNPGYVLHTLLTPEKLRYALQILLPLAFLPLRRVHLWLVLIPGAFFTLLTTGYGPTTDIAFQYSGHWIAYIFPASALALASFAPTGDGLLRRRAAVGAVLVAVLLANQHWGAIPPRDSVRGGFGMVTFGPLSPGQRQKARDLAELGAMVPASAALAVSENELPHLSARLDCYSLRDGYDGAAYILYDVGSGNFGAFNAQKARDSGRYTEIAARGNLVLLRRVP